MSDIRPYTIFCDLDGTLVKHNAPNVAADPSLKLELLSGTIQKLLEWEKKGYNIILVTGRKESMRSSTETQLRNAGIFYDQLIMGIGGGQRIIINDKKFGQTEETCSAISISRDSGIANLLI